MTHPIVVAVSGGVPGREAVTLGVGMARTLQAPLVLAGVAVTPASIGPAVVPGWVPAYPDAGTMEDDVRDATSGFTALVPDDVSCTVDAVTAPSVVDGLDRIASAHEASLLVVGSSHLRAAARAVRGDIALGLLRRSGCSVLVVPDDARRTASGRAPKVVGVAWDRSPEAADALAAATDLAERTGADLRVLHVLGARTPLATPYLDPDAYAQFYADERAQAQRDVDHVATVARRRVPATAVVREGLIAAELEALSQEVDVLVVGSRRHGPLRRIALGSTSEAAVHRAHCPLLIVPRGARSAVIAA